MTSDQTSELYWQSYIQLVLNKAGIGRLPHSDSRAVFVSPAIDFSVPASAFIPMATTNLALYHTVDKLLGTSEDEVFLNAAPNTSFFDNLKMYMRAVEDPEPATAGHAKRLQDLQDAEAELADASTRKEVQYALAFPAWIADPDPNKLPFRPWSKRRATGYYIALGVFEEKLTNYDRLMMETDELSQLIKYRSKLRDIEDIVSHRETVEDFSPAWAYTLGCMPTSDLPVADLELAIMNAKAAVDFKPVEEPLDTDVRINWKPAYSIDSLYRATMDSWARNFGDMPDSFHEISSSSVHEFKWSEIGHSESAGKASASGWGLFRAGARHGESHTWEKGSTDYNKDELEIKLFWKAMRIFDVNTGSWDIPDVYSRYPKTRPGATVPDRRFVRPTQLICATGLGARITVLGQTKKTIDEHVKRVYNTSGDGGGRLGFLGFSAKAKGSTSSEKTTDTHEFDWDETTGTLQILATPTFGAAQLLGIIAEREIPATV